MLGMWKASRAILLPLLALAVMVGATPASAAETQGPKLLDQKVTALQQMHDQRRDLLLNLAGEPLLRAFLKAATPEDAKKLSLAKHIQPNALGAELCLIDKHGMERMRMVNGRIASDWELAHDEADAPFYAEAFAHPAGKVLISRPYLSPDASEWVTAYTTQVVEGEAILHFEHSLLKDIQLVTSGVGPADRQFLLGVLDTGEVVIDSRRAADPAAAFALAQDEFSGPLLTALRGGQTGSLKTQIGGQPWTVTYKPVDAMTLALFERQK